MDEWVAKYKADIAARQNMNRNEETEVPEVTEASATDKNMWESITKLCDFTAKGPKSVKDQTRMRSIFLNMKVQQKANWIFINILSIP